VITASCRCEQVIRAAYVFIAAIQVSSFSAFIGYDNVSHCHICLSVTPTRGREYKAAQIHSFIHSFMFIRTNTNVQCEQITNAGQKGRAGHL